jgi:hypothetical protein
MSREQLILTFTGRDAPGITVQKAGHGIAFHAKPRLREAAHTAISAMGLDSILYLLGITGRDIASLEQA